MICRIAIAETEIQVSAEMLNTVLHDDQLPFCGDLSIMVEDSKHSVVNHLGRVFPNDDLVVITRSGSNRVYRRICQADPAQGVRSRTDR